MNDDPPKTTPTSASTEASIEEILQMRGAKSPLLAKKQARLLELLKAGTYSGSSGQSREAGSEVKRTVIHAPIPPVDWDASLQRSLDRIYRKGNAPEQDDSD